mmetsp:Transcript_16871/g.14790  ORF Transcript_16871/g.14790 Transcript_16871/m.14790 type:complete len:147 (-) Transcript_16871:10-450(-)
MDILNDPENHKIADPGLAEIKILEEVDSDTIKSEYAYRRMKGNFIISAREFIYFLAIFTAGGSSPSDKKQYYIVSFSVDHEDAPKTKHVTGLVENLFVLKEINEENTQIEEVYQISLKGSIPKLVHGLVKDKMFDEIKNFKKLFEA